MAENENTHIAAATKESWISAFSDALYERLRHSHFAKEACIQTAIEALPGYLEQLCVELPKNTSYQHPEQVTALIRQNKEYVFIQFSFALVF